MRFLKILTLLCAAMFFASCSTSKFKTYDGPEVTQIYVNKTDRKMYLLHHDKILKKYNIDLGFAPGGHKQFEGDGKTPEGDYFIDRRNPNSSFHLSLGISYPNAQDVAFARSQGKSPGGDIFIHGRAKKFWFKNPDWTVGCISVKNHEMEEIFAMVKNGTRIRINP